MTDETTPRNGEESAGADEQEAIAKHLSDEPVRPEPDDLMRLRESEHFEDSDD